MDLLIPVLILGGMAALIVYSTIKERRSNRRKEEPKEQAPRYAYPPMDLRLKHEPCGREDLEDTMKEE